LINILYLEVVKKYDWSFKKHLIAENFNSESFDYLFLGNSLVMDAIDAELLTEKGYSAFNLSIGGATVETNILQLKSYMENGNKVPECVILGVGNFLGNDHLSDIIHPAVKYTEQPYLKTLFEIPLLTYSWVATELLKRVISKHHRNAKIVKGQLRISKKVKDKSVYSDNTVSELNSDYYKVDKIDSFARVCNHLNIRLIVIEMPALKSFQNDIDIGPYEFNGNDFQFTFYNLNNRTLGKIFDGERDWLGNSHLNENGAIKLTQYLIDSKILK